MLVIEDILDRIARTLGLPPEVVRERNLLSRGRRDALRPAGEGRRRASQTHLATAEGIERLRRRRREVDRVQSPRIAHAKRGIAITPVKFGISFTATFFNQAGALVLVYRDGSVQVNHGGTEMGQGLHTKIRQIAAEAWASAATAVRVMPTRTDKVPNTSATAASAGTDLNGAAVRGCLRADREARAGSSDVAGSGLLRWADRESNLRATWCEAAYRQRMPLFAQGYYRTPEIHYDPQAATGKPFHYFAYGAAVSEVEVDGFTGEHRLLRDRYSGRRRRFAFRR